MVFMKTQEASQSLDQPTFPYLAFVALPPFPSPFTLYQVAHDSDSQMYISNSDFSLTYRSY
jgi:hypothetical protein